MGQIIWGLLIVHRRITNLTRMTITAATMEHHYVPGVHTPWPRESNFQVIFDLILTAMALIETNEGVKNRFLLPA